MRANTELDPRRRGLPSPVASRPPKRLLVLLLPALAMTVAAARGGEICSPWTDRADMPTGRLGARATSSHGRMYVVGGYRDANGPGLTTLEEYDPATDSWSTLAPMSTGRRRVAFGSVDGKLYAIGGNQSLGAPSLGTVEVYDPALDEWTRGADMPTPRFAPASAVVDGRIYVIGGMVRPPGGTTTPSSVVEVYDPAAGVWSVRSDAPTRRGGHAAAVAEGRIYVLGGTMSSPDVPLTTVEMYDSRTDTWQFLGDMPSAKSLLSAVTVSGKIYAIGGMTNGRRAVADVEVFDPAVEAWTTASQLPQGRWDPAAAELAGRVYTIGGATMGPPPHPGVRTTIAYDPRFAASFTVSEGPRFAGEEILFDATSTELPPEAMISEYRWDFGDGATAEGAITRHSYDAPGRHLVRLEVSSDKGVCDLQTRLLRIDTTGGELGPWTAFDVGDPAFPGAAWIESDSDSERLRLWAGGDVLSGRDDEHFLVAQQVECDGSLTARLDDAALALRAQVGLTIRASEQVDAQHVSLIFERSFAGARLRVRHRSEAAGTTTNAGDAADASLPVWLRLERAGDEIRVFWSPDGSESFRLLATSEFPGLGSTALFGFAGMGAEPTSETAPFVMAGATWSGIELACPPAVPRFLRGDCNSDGMVNLSDAIRTLGFLFLGERGADCDDACDSNDDGGVDLSDAIATLGALFLGNEVIPLPGMTECGVDPTEDEQGCGASERCP